jgi:hypothetical protein
VTVAGVGVLVARVAPVDVVDRVIACRVVTERVVAERVVSACGVLGSRVRVGDAARATGLATQVEQGFGAASGEVAVVVGAGGDGERVEGLEQEIHVGDAVDPAREGGGAVAAVGDQQLVAGFGFLVGGGAVGVEGVQQPGDDPFQPGGREGSGGFGEHLLGRGDLAGLDPGDAAHLVAGADQYAQVFFPDLPGSAESGGSGQPGRHGLTGQGHRRKGVFGVLYEVLPVAGVDPPQLLEESAEAAVAGRFPRAGLAEFPDGHEQRMLRGAGVDHGLTGLGDHRLVRGARGTHTATLQVPDLQRYPPFEHAFDSNRSNRVCRVDQPQPDQHWHTRAELTTLPRVDTARRLEAVEHEGRELGRRCRAGVGARVASCSDSTGADLLAHAAGFCRTLDELFRRAT